MYIENNCSVVTQHAYGGKYRGRQTPSDNTIRLWFSNFVEQGTVGDCRQVVHRRPRRPNELVEAVIDNVSDNPHVSYRQRAQHFGVSGTTLRRILKENLHLVSYKAQLTQKILPTDSSRRLEYDQKVA
ncbi:Helix-turn-helix domain (DUF4817) [Popillia japonica]|uniref:Helix-turn-helix domain (DUF4817) n=1 Tax=Popillia japonica TaxID=7064 RepID=A0AAW1MME9_POPJA